MVERVLPWVLIFIQQLSYVVNSDKATYKRTQLVFLWLLSILKGLTGLTGHVPPCIRIGGLKDNFNFVSIKHKLPIYMIHF